MKNYLVDSFDKDITLNGGYLYTTNAILSSQLANERLTRATTKMVKLTGKTVIDVGCGDGSYTYELFRRFKPKNIVGVDASRNAIKLAQTLYKKSKKIDFVYGSIYDLQKRFNDFDVAIVRGVIHHVDYPEKAIQSVTKIAANIVILEPNGYNPFLKIIEKISLYHRIHKERSYAPFRLKSWIKKAGFRVLKNEYVGLVPFFCPDGMARTLKQVEPLAESIPLIKKLLCAVYVVSAKKA